MPVNRTTVIIAVVIILLLLGGGAGAFFMMKKTPQQAQVATQNTTPLVPTKNPIEKKSFKDFMNLTTTQKCTYKDPQTQNSGTVYASSGKTRGDFTMIVSEQAQTSHMMSDGEYVYSWVDGQNNGFKMSLASMEQFQADAQKKPQQGAVDVNRQVDYECSNWTADNSVFIAPSNIKFQDYSKMMEGVKKMSPAVSGAQDTNIKASQCAACNQLPEDQQSQCKSTLKC